MMLRSDLNKLFSIALLLLLASPASAIPIIDNNSDFAFTENRGPNNAGFGVNHVLQLGVTVSDVSGVPDNIDTVTATSLSTGVVTSLPFLNIGSIFSGLYNSITPYNGETGQWQIDVTDKQGNLATVTTHNLDDVRVIPLANNLQVSGSLLAPLVTWDPVLFDGLTEVDDYRIRLLNSSSDQFFRSDPIIGNSFQVPAGLIVPGVTHIRLVARDFDNGALENRSSTFTQFIAPVPEPSILALMFAGLVGLGFARRRRTL